MKKKYIYIPLAVLALSLTACSTPKKDVAGLSAEIDAASKGHYGQALLHASAAEKDLKTANHVLKHWQNDYYWNIDETLKAQEAAKSAAAHISASEKEYCQWLTDVHGKNHHEHENVHETVAYFKTASDVPFKTKDDTIGHIGRFLHEHPDASATVAASTDTVGKPAYNQDLSERRARTVSNMLIKQGAKPSQLVVTATGEAHGPDNTADQSHRVAVVLTSHPAYIDCPNVK
ncbi:OmpA family protein [Methylomonas montana]|uniref:OmpA family protein n=1 Tax=Methylomonas montana TaxID=3058963 RepID=UPI002659E74B|nr:OmpA family protein [Methylomonas montana]WKJ90814.1 OmpA family protein [Methylomonas montana]